MIEWEALSDLCGARQGENYGVDRTRSVKCRNLVGSLGNHPFDQYRIAARVASGIGFIGAGVIFREGLPINELNTAICRGRGLSIPRPQPSSLPRHS
jgi:hypothetical protein